MSLITKLWLSDMGGIVGVSPSSAEFWDFPIVGKYCNGVETYLRVHEPNGDNEWATDLFDQNGQSVGIVNWPKSRQQMLNVLDALGCARTRESINFERRKPAGNPV